MIDPWDSTFYTAAAAIKPSTSDGFGQRSSASTSCKYGTPLNKNTYTNKGSTNIDENPVAMPLAQCLVRCSDDSECSCVVVVPCDDVDCACWKRKQCVEADMEDSNQYQVYMKKASTCQSESDNDPAISEVSSASGDFKVSLGYTFEDTIGHTLMVYNFKGEPVACALLEEKKVEKIVSSVLSTVPDSILFLILLVVALYP